MATKREGVPCYEKAAADEPIFVLRAQDLLAPTIVADWACRAKTLGVNKEKVMAARRCAREMLSWQRSHTAKVPD